MQHRHIGWLAGLLLALVVPASQAAEEVKVVVVANWENGADSGDAPGEYQDWVEREHLDQKLAVRGAPDVVRRNAQGLYGIVLRHGAPDRCRHRSMTSSTPLSTMLSGTSFMRALLSRQRDQ